jgi:hypothetical protein
MTVSAQSPVITYTANGSATVFDYPFLIIQATDLKVYLNSVEVTTGFSVSGAGVEDGGSVTFTVAPADTTEVKLIRSISLDRTTDYVEGGPLRSAVLNADIDRVVMMVQDVRADAVSTIEFEAIVSAVNADAAAAAASAAEAASTLVDFASRYLGSKATAPTLDNEGDALTEGALYWDSTLNEMFVFDSASWVSWIPVQRTDASVIVPSITTGERDAVPAAGYFHFNNTLNQFEGYNGSEWGAVGGGATGGAGNYAFYENDQTVTVDYTLTAGKNAMTAGPITIASGVTVTIPSGATWSIV